MGNYRLSEIARLDLDELYVYGILNFGLKAADSYYDGLIERFGLLVQHPSWGSDYGHIRPDLQRYEYRSHSIYYLPRAGGILIVRVLGKRQDPARHF